MIEHAGTLRPKGIIKVYAQHNPSVILFEDHNVIVNSISTLFARLMKAHGEVKFGVWGLAVGSGDPSWASMPEPPDGTEMQAQLFNQIRRKALWRSRYVDDQLEPVTGFSNNVKFLTILNATTDDLIDQPIREIGLIGGGSVADNTTMETARFWIPSSDLGKDPAGPTKPADTVVLINYKTLPGLVLPPAVNIVFDWTLCF